ncbi:glycoside hydrolase family 31 protein [Sphingomonas sp. JC676]|uniref:glycoside hydrolase family 31 protein n=1 Tax=Sphingomonas sp. JC676 TaxID=2768065 RepID=UPI001658133C|nr:TIM-barrel domain-containing protein [Sphingomonas sp. JC676]MBC9035161.1 glycoside hydrolase family 31 protein [Sphingomonas sp. JC676]
MSHYRALLACTALLAASPAAAQSLATLDRNGGLVSIEAYAPNIIHVTIALDRSELDRGAGPGVSAKPDPRGWTHSVDAAGDSFVSTALSVTVNAQPWPKAPTQMERYFAPSLPPVSILIRRPDGRAVTTMQGWEMAPQEVNGEDTFRVGASFADTPGTHYYGLGQNQEGQLDLRGRTVDCRHNYDAPAGETVCVPFLVTSQGYGIVWDNPSTTAVSPGLHGRTTFQSKVGERVSFFVIAGDTTDDLYAGYARLTGATPLPPKAAFGLIQSKARYESQAELLGIAEGYRKRGYPLDVMVLDWFYWTRMGQLDVDRAAFPDPAGMNKQLHDAGMHSILSVWPRFERESRYYDMLAAKGWLLKDKQGKPADGLAVRSDRAGALLDSTNPEARSWFWEKIRDNLASQGFDWFWLDETEPDLVPDGYFYSIGSGDRYHNLFPLVHTAGVAEGSAKDRPTFRNLILARAAYLGAQASGALFWTSDVQSTWEALRRQVPANLNMAASGIAYTSSDTGGWQWPSGPAPERPVLVDPAGATAMAPSYRDYPELFVRWFQLNSFTPTLRIHGQRPATAIWEYGSAAEPILADFLRLRYRLIPYLYSMGYQTYRSGAPFMRALFMDFPKDAEAATIGDQYMFGPAFLVAPILDQGVTHRRVYLPAGCDWYDWYSNEKHAGGQWIDAAAPIERMPLFVRAGSIVPLGADIATTSKRQPLTEIRVYPGAEGSFSYYDDDGVTNGYKSGVGRPVVLRWDDSAKRLTASGKLPTGQDAQALVRVVAPTPTASTPARSSR